MLIGIFVVGLWISFFGSFAFFGWCAAVANKEYNKEGDFLPKFLASVAIITISLGCAYAEFHTLQEHYQSDETSEFVVCLIAFIIGTIVGIIVPFAQKAKERKIRLEKLESDLGSSKPFTELFNSYAVGNDTNKMKNAISDLRKKYYEAQELIKKYSRDEILNFYEKHKISRDEMNCYLNYLEDAKTFVVTFDERLKAQVEIWIDSYDESED